MKKKLKKVTKKAREAKKKRDLAILKLGFTANGERPPQKPGADLREKGNSY